MFIRVRKDKTCTRLQLSTGYSESIFSRDLQKCSMGLHILTALSLTGIWKNQGKWLFPNVTAACSQKSRVKREGKKSTKQMESQMTRHLFSEGTGVMACVVKCLPSTRARRPEFGSIPSTHLKSWTWGLESWAQVWFSARSQAIHTCNSSSRGCDTLFWPLVTHYTHSHTQLCCVLWKLDMAACI